MADEWMDIYAYKNKTCIKRGKQYYSNDTIPIIIE